MAGGLKSLTKPMATLLRPGEQLLGGCKAAGKNAIAKGVVGGAAASAIPGAKSTGGMSDVVPQEKIFWVGATNQRLVYFGVSAFSSQPKKFRGETPLEAITSVEVKRQKITRRLVISFQDGSATTVDLYRSNSPDELQTALEQVLRGRVTDPG